MTEQLRDIKARLAEKLPDGRQVLHTQGCTYSRSDTQFACDCVRVDLEWLVVAVEELGEALLWLRCDPFTDSYEAADYALNGYYERETDGG